MPRILPAPAEPVRRSKRVQAKAAVNYPQPQPVRLNPMKEKVKNEEKEDVKPAVKPTAKKTMVSRSQPVAKTQQNPEATHETKQKPKERPVHVENDGHAHVTNRRKIARE